MTQTPAKPQNSDQTTFLASEQASNQLLKDQANSAAPGKKKEFLTRSQLDLQKTLLLWGLPLVLAPLATLTFLGYRIVHQKQKESLQTQLNSRLVTVTQAVQDTVDEAVKTTKWIAEDDLVIQAAKQGNLIAKQQKLNQLSESQLEEKFSTSKLIRPNQTWNQYLARVGKIGETAEIFFTNTDGLNVAYSNPTSDFVQQDEIWWQMAKKQGIWVSPMSYDESAATNSFSVSQRINQPNSGEFLGVVKTVFATEKFSQIWQYLNQLPLTETESIQLVDWQKAETVAQLNSTGTNINQVIVGSEQFQKLIKAIGEIATQQPVSDWTTKIKQLTQQYQLSELKNKTWQNAQGNKFLLLSFIYQGREYSISSLPISNILAIVSVDNAEIEAAGNDIVGSFVLLSAMIFIITSTASWWLARRLSAPLQELVEKAEAFAAGDLNVFAQPQGTRETQTLADSFNKLIKQVRNLLSKQELATQRANVIAEISSARTINQEDLYQTFNQALQKSRPLLGVERLTIHFFNPDGSTYIINEDLDSQYASTLNQKLEADWISSEATETYRRGEIHLVKQNQMYLAPEYRNFLSKYQINQSAIAPILNQNQLYGLLVADCCGENNQELNKDNLEFLQQIAQELGIILERVSLLEQERLAKQERIAKEQLQQRILDLLLEVDPVSRGDLTIRAKVTDDEIGTVADSYNSTIESLNLLVSKVKTVANQVQTTASCNEEAIKQLSNEAITQAETITEVVKNIQSMNESIRQIAANATTAENAVLEANQTVEAGEMAMEQTVTGILAIRDTVTETTEKVKRLEESSANISGIINLIGRFAAQTHLLALKASIEAARAGDKGKGFAVIADEVRSLAAQSAEATNQIENLVAKIQVDTKEVMEAMVTGTEQVVKGTELVERTRLSLNQITNSSLKIERLVQDISQATIEQNQTSELVVTTIEEVAKIAQNNSLAASQVLASFEDLLSLAEQLQADVGKFKVK